MLPRLAGFRQNGLSVSGRSQVAENHDVISATGIRRPMWGSVPLPHDPVARAGQRLVVRGKRAIKWTGSSSWWASRLGCRSSDSLLREGRLQRGSRSHSQRHVALRAATLPVLPARSRSESASAMPPRDRSRACSSSSRTSELRMPSSAREASRSGRFRSFLGARSSSSTIPTATSGPSRRYRPAGSPLRRQSGGPEGPPGTSAGPRLAMRSCWCEPDSRERNPLPRGNLSTEFRARAG